MRRASPVVSRRVAQEVEYHSSLTEEEYEVDEEQHTLVEEIAAVEEVTCEHFSCCSLIV